MPGRRQNRVLALGAIHGEEVQRLVMRVVKAYWYYNVTGADISPTCKGLLQPELFQSHLAAVFGFLFPLATFLVFLFVGNAGAAVLKLYLGTETPAFAEVVPKIDYSMRDIETAMAWVIAVLLGLTISTYVVAEEIAGVGHFAIASHSKARRKARQLSTVGVLLGMTSCANSQN